MFQNGTSSELDNWSQFATTSFRIITGCDLQPVQDSEAFLAYGQDNFLNPLTLSNAGGIFYL